MAQVVPEPDPPEPLCQWLDETVERTPKPSEWKADEVQGFSNCILGDPSMKYKLIVRQCYIQMHAQIMTWLQDKFSLATPPIGMFVITGTPGIGKSVFLAYMVAFLVEQGYSIVIQIGQKFWSRQSGSGKTVSHGKTEPKLLEDAKAVLLADPLGGEDTKVEHRRAGCTIVFTSLRESCYKVSFKQQQVYSQKRYMPVWSKEELVEHRAVLFSDKSEAVEQAHACLGGSVRWLAELLANWDGKADLASKAEELICKYMEHLDTFDQLYDLLKCTPIDNMEDKGRQNAMSYLLQIHTECPFQEPVQKFITSQVAENVLCKKLSVKTKQEQEQFLTKFLRTKPLGTLVGKVFQSLVLERLTGKGNERCSLQCKPLALKGQDEQTSVPNQKFEMQTHATKLKCKLTLGCVGLYCPLSETFPAADFFFATNTGSVLWLLQMTKNEDKHDCKIGKMREEFEKHFDKASLEKVSTIKWVIVAPEVIASNYKKPQTVHGEWKIGSKAVEVEQYVSSWKVSP